MAFRQSMGREAQNVVQINEQFILTKAPNPAAVKNGRTLSGKGSFTARRRTADDTLYWADCAGSG